MRRSKLEVNLDILKVLARKGPLKLTHIMYKANVNCDILKKSIEFLKKHSLVEERMAGRGLVVYSISRLGLTLLKSWKEINQMLPTDAEDRKLEPFQMPYLRSAAKQLI